MHRHLIVNGQVRELEAPAGRSLLAVLRDDLDLTGAKYGCGDGGCGACMVLVDGEATPSCVTPVEAVTGKQIVTIEGLAAGSALHPVQQAFLEEDAMQCGYCTAGMVINAVALLSRVAAPTEEQIRDALSPNLCRCGVYQRAIGAVKRASR